MKTKPNKKIAEFNPDQNFGFPHHIFGLPFNLNEANVVLIPVPWEVTASSGSGASNGPGAIFNASFQLDLYDYYIKDAWACGIAMETVSEEISVLNTTLKPLAEEYIHYIEKHGSKKVSQNYLKIQQEINVACAEMINWTKAKCQRHLTKDKVVGLVGGDHSVSQGLIMALSEIHDSFGILHIDAHADLRKAYMGLEYSHASIMYNALQIPNVSRVVSIGVRDFCHEEATYYADLQDKLFPFFDWDIKRQFFMGRTWDNICQMIASALPEKIYISFDIDGLIPTLCPSTGTPVPGGLDFEQVVYLLEKIAESNTRIIGFDLVEVAPGESGLDENVGARVLYKLATITAKTNNFI